MALQYILGLKPASLVGYLTFNKSQRAEKQLHVQEWSSCSSASSMFNAAHNNHSFYDERIQAPEVWSQRVCSKSIQCMIPHKDLMIFVFVKRRMFVATSDANCVASVGL